MNNMRDTFEELAEIEFNEYYYGVDCSFPYEQYSNEINEEHESFCHRMDMLEALEQDDIVNWWVE